MSRRVAAEVVDTVELLTSEIVTNAILHGRAGPKLIVEIDDGVVRVGVHDMGPDVPVRRIARADDVSGRGVVIVDELASAWGVEPELGGGKRVWFEVAAPPFLT
ncbi:MAG: ATP-binding protein [Actinomycetota bacterium]|nr:ATP-binding protein [Actinomycetota bacterium]